MYSLVYWISTKKCSVIEDDDIKDDKKRGLVAQRGKNYYPVKVIKQSKFKNLLEKIEVDSTGKIVEKTKRKYIKKSDKSKPKNEADSTVISSKSIIDGVSPISEENQNNSTNNEPNKKITVVEDIVIQKNIKMISEKPNEEFNILGDDKSINGSSCEDDNTKYIPKNNHIHGLSKKFKRAYVYSSDSESDELSNGEKSIEIKDKFIEETNKKTFQSQKALHPKKLAKVTKSGVNNEDDAIPSCSFHNLPPKNLDKVEKNLAKTEKNLGIMDKNFDTWPRVTPEYINFTECYLRQMKTLYARQQQDPAKIKTSISIVPEVNQRQYKVYKGLDIITAKVTEEERSLASHHMLDFVDPLHNYCVIDFKKAALPIINDLIVKRKMPIIVGGTNYYIESLLWHILLDDPEASEMSKKRHDSQVFDCPTTDDFELNDDDKVKNFVTLKKMKYDDNEHSNETLHQKLASVDPEMARRLHPNNRRKIIRSLEVFENHGTTHSEILKHQRTAGGCGLGGPLRFPNSLILWLKCDQKILDIRLDRRVDSMLEAGLVSELLGFHERYNQERLKINALPDYTKGIFQSIGFKEFHNYLILPDTEKRSEQGIALLRQGISDLKLVTRRYARRQQKWIMNRFIKRIDRQVPPVYDLDCTNIEEWNSKVLESAIEIINAKLRGDVHTQKPLNGSSLDEKFSDSSNEESRWCEICQKILIGELQWKSHKNGAKHKKMEIKKRKVMSHHINENKISFIC